MKHVVFISHGFPDGGVARVTLDLIRWFTDRTDAFRFTILTDRPVGLDELPAGFSGKVALVPARKPGHKAVELGADFLIQCSRHEKDILTARKAGIKIIYVEHGEPFHERYAITDRRKGGQRKRRFRHLLWKLYVHRLYDDGTRALRMAVSRTRKAYDQSDAFVVLCEGYRRTLEREMGVRDKVHVIENPQNPVLHPTLEKEKLLLFSGRLTEYDKNVSSLLRIWGKVQDRLPDYRLEIVGDGSDRGNLEALSRELGLKRCCFAGWRKDVSDWYRKADILCLTSRFEGWPLCLTEAQSHGVIPVSFHCSLGVEEILSPSGENGFLVPYGDEEAFAETLVAAASLPEAEKHVLRENCIRKAAAYDMDRYGEKWLALLEGLSAKDGTAAKV